MPVISKLPDPSKYAGYLLLACVGSALKIKLPRIQGTMSISFLFILVGVTELTFVETVLLGCAAALVQCLWKPRKRPALMITFSTMSPITMTKKLLKWMRVGKKRLPEPAQACEWVPHPKMPRSS